MMNAASAGAACGLCRARRRTTNEVQSNICIVSIQILRRSAPQNNKLLNCSQTPQQTGMCKTGGNAERWREKMFGAVAACRDKHRLSAGRAETPPCGGSQNLQIPVLNGARPAGFGTRTFDVPLLNPGTDCGSCNTANCKTEKTAIIALKNKRYL